jgi:L-serine dehydratase
MRYDSIASLVAAAAGEGCAISDVVIRDQQLELRMERGALMAQMLSRFDTMCAASQLGSSSGGLRPPLLCPRDAADFAAFAASGRSIGGGIFDSLIGCALAVASHNAGMGKIVAAPTAGSCGIIPAVLITAVKYLGASRESAAKALFTSGAVGMVIASRATLSGAQGGCQAECGSAAAMAAAALTELASGTPDMAANACAIALKSQLGLVCDPVAGLVEVPCIKRNATGAVLAWTAADMALAGIKSFIPADEVIDAMRSVGDLMPAALRETSEGGLAASPTAAEAADRLRGGQ